MKINAFNSILTNKIQSQRQAENKTFLQSSPNDIFVKSTSNVSFGSMSKLNDKFFPFCRELKEYIYKTKSIDIAKVEQIVQKYSPTTLVKPMQELPGGTNATEQTAAYFTNRLLFSADGKIKVEDKAIFLNIPQKTDKESKLNFLCDILHEMTHIFQEESSDRLSKVTFLNDFLKDKQINKDTISVIQAMPKAFSVAESNIIMPLIKSLKKENDLPLTIKENSKNILDKIYAPQTQINSVDDFITLIILKTQEYIQNNFCVTDKKAITKYIALVSEKEKEAYQKSTQFLKRELNIKDPTDLDLRVTLYDAFSKKAQELSNQV